MPTSSLQRVALLPSIPSEQDQAQARLSSRALIELMQNRQPSQEMILSSRRRNRTVTIPLPPAAAPLIAQILSEMGRGNPVTVIPVHSELTTQQAAGLLGVSRPHFVKLLNQRKVPFRKVGSHRRVLLADLMAYKEKEHFARQKILDELAKQSQKIGLGY